MTRNQDNKKYKSALEGLPFEARQMDGQAIEFRGGTGRKMEAHKFYLRPVPRSQPDIERLGRAILELAMRGGDQPSAPGKPCQT
ncbi:MAG: hypothetical protein FWF60_08215 [Oscillospiraceae bacterium]|jgi:hypothetical protein|nr:hypothetical protein [Oscillospiraceae bacterium]